MNRFCRISTDGCRVPESGQIGHEKQQVNPYFEMGLRQVSPFREQSPNQPRLRLRPRWAQAEQSLAVMFRPRTDKHGIVDSIPAMLEKGAGFPGSVSGCISSTSFALCLALQAIGFGWLPVLPSDARLKQG